MVADQQSQILADELSHDPVLVFANLDGGLDTDSGGDSLKQFAHVLQRTHRFGRHR